MPTIGTNTLNQNMQTIRKILTIYSRRKIVQPPVNVGIAAGPITRGDEIVGHLSLEENFRSVSKVPGLQILPHPALRTKLHGFINISIIVGYRGWTRVVGSQDKGLVRPIRNTRLIHGVCPIVIGDIR